MPETDIDVVGNWTEIKLNILKDYSQAYAKILSKHMRTLMDSLGQVCTFPRPLVRRSKEVPRSLLISSRGFPTIILSTSMEIALNSFGASPRDDLM